MGKKNKNKNGGSGNGASPKAKKSPGSDKKKGNKLDFFSGMMGKNKKGKDKSSPEVQKSIAKNSNKGSKKGAKNGPGAVVPGAVNKLKKMTDKLQAGKFRWLNEQLYTTTSNEAWEFFQESPELFEEYHKGFRLQTELWPEKPVEKFIKMVKKMPKETVVVDFGCGDAELAQSVPQKVHSFDLVSPNKHVVACDMRKVPLEGGVADVAIFCLSLMGTNYVEFLVEAHRVLKMGGRLLIAEVTSRVEDLKAFLRSIENLGFTVNQKDTSNTHFVVIGCTKRGEIKAVAKSKDLKACIYKRR